MNGDRRDGHGGERDGTGGTDRDGADAATGVGSGRLGGEPESASAAFAGRGGPPDGPGVGAPRAASDGASTPTAEPTTAAHEELADASWHLDAGEVDQSLRRLLARLPATARLVAGIVREAAPRAAAVLFVLQVASGLAGAFGLLATTGVLEELVAGGPTPERVRDALPALAVVVAAAAVRGALGVGATLAQARIGPAVDRVAAHRVVAAALAVDLAAFDDPTFHDRIHRARDRGLYYLRRAVDNLVQVLAAGIAVAAAAASLAVLHPVLVPVLAVGVAPEGWAVLRSARLGYAGMARTIPLARRLDMVADLAMEREPAAEIRASQAQGFLLDEHARLADALRDQQVEVAMAQARAQSIGRALAGVGSGIAVVTLGVLLHAGWVALAVAGTAVIAIRVAGQALTELVVAANQLFEHGLYVADVEAFTAEAARRTPPAGRLPPAGGPHVVGVEGVGFRYPGSSGGRPALDDVRLTIRRGETVALVGENGSGKTTLAKVVAGLYRPTAGRVTWDGVDVAELDPAAVAARAAVVLQHPLRWPHDARANVRVGRHDRVDPGDAALLAAAVLGGADKVVDGLPRRWRTLLSKEFREGRELSAGEWQRFAVARGLFRDAPIVIWDEPTAPLDARAEAAVYEALRHMATGRTVVLITHRLASVRHVDRIYLLHEGRLVEQGSHDELIALGGRYAELFDLQARLHATPLTAPPTTP